MISLPSLQFGTGNKHLPDPAAILNRRSGRLPQQAYSLKLLGITGGVNQFGLDVMMGLTDELPDEKEMSVVINFADGNSKDGVGDVLEVGGIDTERHRKNPIVLFDHGKEVKLPVALAEHPDTREYTVSIDVINKIAKAKAFFYRGNGLQGINKAQEYDHALFCEQLFDLMCKRYVRAGSIGYQVKSADHLHPYERDEKGNPVGLHLLSVLMLECSAVVLPANQDTTRKALSLPLVCGKKMSPVLYKSLSGNLPVNTSVSIAIPHGDLSTTKIPPPRMNPGNGVEVTKGFLDKVRRTTETFSDIEGMEDYINRIFVNPVDRHVFWVGDIQKKALEEVKRRLKEIKVWKFSKNLKSTPKGDNWKVWVKGSYFQNCPRDQTGHCLPQQAHEETSKKPSIPKPDGSVSSRNQERGTGKEESTDVQSIQEKEVWAKGKWGLIVEEGVVTRCGDPSIKIGSSMTEDELVKKGWKRVEPKAAPPKNTGTERGKSMAVKNKQLQGNGNTKQIPPNAPPKKPMGGEEVPMTADPAMNATIDPEVDTTQLNAQDGADVAVDETEDYAEPYGAGFVRQVRKDMQILMEDYHDMVRHLDNPRIMKLAERMISGFEKNMAVFEEAFAQEYGERGLKDLNDDMSGPENVAMGEENSEADNIAADVIENTESGVGAEEIAGDVAGAEQEAVNDPMGDDDGAPTDNTPLERPDPSEVPENMRRPDLKDFKSLRTFYRQKSMSACKSCGMIGCKCSKGLNADGEKKINQSGTASPNSSGGTIGRIGDSDQGGKIPPRRPNAGSAKPGYSTTKIPKRTEHPDVEAQRGKYPKPDTTPPDTDGPIDLSQLKSADAFEDTGEPGHKALDDREQKWLNGTLSFLKDLADETKLFDEEKRLECKGWHKVMDEVGDYSAHIQTKKPKKKGLKSPDDFDPTSLDNMNQFDPSSLDNSNQFDPASLDNTEPLPDLNKMQADEEQEMTDMNGDAAMYKADPVRSLCKAAADYLNAMSREKAFGSYHRSYAKELVKAIEETLTKSVPDTSEDPTPVDEQESLVELAGVDEGVASQEVGDLNGEKSLSLRCSEELTSLTKQLETLVRCF